MSGVRDVFKSGWHPTGKDGGKESWRGDYKGINQVAGWVGKGKKPGETSTQGSSHVSRPLATLKDPSLFGPPPKNVNFHGGAALPNEITPQTGGIGAPLSQHEIASARYSQANQAEDEEETARPAPPPLPYRSDHTGLRTDNLPPPPVRRDSPGGDNVRQLLPRTTPNLPPRLPSRQNTASSPVNAASPPPPAYETPTQVKSPASSLNQSAMNRLGNAGVSVPSLGIGRKNGTNGNSPWQKETSQKDSMSELSSRFKKFNSSTNMNSNKDNNTISSPTEQPSAPAPSWAQTQASLKTAQNFHKDPSSVSLADAQQAATTAQQAHNNAQAFRARHADKIDAAERKATAINKKYNMTGRLNKFLEDANNEHDQHQQQQQQAPPPPVHPGAATTAYQRPSPSPPIPSPPISTQPSAADPETLTKSIGRKPPPPPPPKKPSNLQAPPPVPLGTRPTFS